MWLVKTLRRRICEDFTKESVSSYIVRFETRGKEFIYVARLNQVALAKAKIPQFTRGLGVKAPLVTWIRPETGRSSPG